MIDVSCKDVQSTVFSAPAMHFGGTNGLLARVASHWQEIAHECPGIIDFSKGGMVKYLSVRNVAFTLMTHRVGAAHRLGPGQQILMSFLPGRTVGWTVLPDRITRIALWCTHPQEGFRWLPTYHFARNWPHASQKRFAQWVHPTYYQKLRRVFQTAIDKGGLYMMDADTSQALSDVFDIPGPHPTIPIFTDAPKIARMRPPGSFKRMCWVGRLEDFKTHTVLAIARDVHALNRKGLALDLDIVGYGQDEQMIRKEVSGYLDPRIRCLGQMQLDDMNRHLATEVDVFCGHGTAILEAAKFGIPSLLADGFYFDLKAGELKYRWLHEDPVGNIGQMLHDKTELRGRTLAECLANSEEVRAAGEKSLARWREAHEPLAATKRIYECLQANTFTYGDLVDAGALDFDWHGGAFMAFKRWWTKNKY